MATKQEILASLKFTADTSQAKRQMQDLIDQINKLATSTKGSSGNGLGITKEIQDATKAAAELQVHLSKAVNTRTGALDLSKFNDSLKKSGKTLQQYQTQLSNLGPTGQKAFASMVQSISNAEIPLKRTNQYLTEMWTTMQNTVKWQLSSSMLHGFMGAIQSAYGYAQDLNESLTNIRIVTGQSADQMAAFAERANKAAQSLSTTTNAYTKAALIFYQQGLNDNDVQARTDAVIKMAQATGDAAEDVSSYMTAIWNNFAEGSAELEHYADVITALGASTASSSSEIAAGLSQFAAIAKTTGLSYEYATSALATLVANTRQSADTIGNSLKTIFSRLQGLSLGETMDDGVNLNKYSKALATVGVNVVEANGQLKNMDNILDELAAKWGTISDAQKMALAQTVAGTRQYTQLLSLMNNWGDMKKNLNTAQSSDGTLQKQADIYAESWEASSKRVRAAAEEIYHALINDDFFIKLNNLMANFLDFVNGSINALSGLKGVLIAIGGIATQVFSRQISTSIDNFVFNIKSAFGVTKKELTNLKIQANKMVKDQIGDSSKPSSAARADAYASQANLQISYIKNADKMSEAERETNQILMDRHALMVQNVESKADEYDKTSLLVTATAAQLRMSEEEVTHLQNQAIRYSTLIRLVTSYQQLLNNNSGGAVLDENTRNAMKASLEELKSGFASMGVDLNSTGLSHWFTSLTEMLNNAETSTDDFKNKVGEMGSAAAIVYSRLNQNAGEATQTFVDQGSAATGLAQNLGQVEKGASKLASVFEDVKLKQVSLTQGITQITGLLTSFASTLRTIQNAFQVWSDDTSTLSDKLSSTAMVLTTVGAVGAGIAKMIVSWKAPIDGLNVALGTTQLTLGPLYVIIAAITVAVVGLIALIKHIKKEAYEASVEGQLEKATEKANSFKEALENTKKAADNLKASFDTYDSLVDKLNGCKNSTLEWSQALLDVNNQVADMVRQYPELVKYVEIGKNGALSFNDEGRTELTRLQNERIAAAIMSSTRADQEARRAKQASIVSGLEKNLNTDYGKTFLWGSDVLGFLQSQPNGLNESNLTAINKARIDQQTLNQSKFNTKADKGIKIAVQEAQERSRKVQAYQTEEHREQLEAVIAERDEAQAKLQELNNRQNELSIPQNRKNYKQQLYNMYDTHLTYAQFLQQALNAADKDTNVDYIKQAWMLDSQAAMIDKYGQEAAATFDYTKTYDETSSAMFDLKEDISKLDEEIAGNAKELKTVNGEIATTEAHISVLNNIIDEANIAGNLTEDEQNYLSRYRFDEEDQTLIDYELAEKLIKTLYTDTNKSYTGDSRFDGFNPDDMSTLSTEAYKFMIDTYNDMVDSTAAYLQWTNEDLYNELVANAKEYLKPEDYDAEWDAEDLDESARLFVDDLLNAGNNLDDVVQKLRELASEEETLRKVERNNVGRAIVSTNQSVLESGYADKISFMAGSAYNRIYEQELAKIQDTNFDKLNTDYMRTFAQSRGFNVDASTQYTKDGNQFVFTDTDKKRQSLNFSDFQEYYADLNALNNLSEWSGYQVQNLAALQNANRGYIDLIGADDLSGLSRSQVNGMFAEGGQNAFFEALKSSGIISDQYTLEDFLTDRGINLDNGIDAALTDFWTAQVQKAEDYNETWEDLGKTRLDKTNAFFGENGLGKDVSQQNAQWLGNIYNQKIAENYNNPKAIEAMDKSFATLFSNFKTTDELNNFLDAMSQVGIAAEMSNEQIAEALTNAGYSIDAATVETMRMTGAFDGLIPTLKAVDENVPTKYSNAHKIVDKLNTGDAISQEDYDKLSAYNWDEINGGLSSCFMYLVDGTYKFIGAAGDLQTALADMEKADMLSQLKDDAEYGQYFAQWNGDSSNKEAVGKYIGANSDLFTTSKMVELIEKSGNADIIKELEGKRAELGKDHNIDKYNDGIRDIFIENFKDIQSAYDSAEVQRYTQAILMSSKSVGELADNAKLLTEAGVDAKTVQQNYANALISMASEYPATASEIAEYRQALKDGEDAVDGAAAAALKGAIAQAKLADAVESATNRILNSVSSLYGTLSNIKSGSSIGTDAYKDVVKQLGEDTAKQFFAMNMDGGFDFVGDEEQYKDLVYGQVNNKINTAQQNADLLNASTITNSQYEINKEAGTRGLSALSTFGNSDLGGAYIQAARDYMDETDFAVLEKAQETGDITVQQMKTVMDTLTSLGLTNSDLATSISDDADQMKTAWALTAEDFDELQEMLEKGQIDTNNFNTAWAVMQKQLDSDLNADEVEDLAKSIMKAATGSDELADSLAKDKKAAKEVAKELSRFNVAVQKVEKNYDNWAETLASSNGDTLKIKDTLNEMADAYGDLLDMDSSSFSDQFLSNSENLELFKQAAEGSVEAYEELANRAQDDILIQCGVDTNNEQIMAEVNALEDTIRNSIDDIEIGAKITDAEAIAAMEDLVNKAGMTAQQASDYLGSMGVDAELEEHTSNTTDTQSALNVEPELAQVTGSNTVPYTGATNPATYSGVRWHISDASQSADSSHTGFTLKVKSATKTSGGNFKMSHGTTSNGGGKKGGGGGGSKAKEPQKKDHKTDHEIAKDLLDDQIKRYREIENLIDDINENITDYSDLANRAFGKTKVDALAKQVKELKKLAQAYDVEREENEMWRQRDRHEAEQYGWTFDSDDDGGRVNNYDELFNSKLEEYNNKIKALAADYNAGVDWWNSLSGEAQDEEENKDKWKEIEKAYSEGKEDIDDEWSKFTESLDKYEETLEKREELIKAQRKALEDALDAEINIVDTTVKVKIDLDDDDLKYLDELIKQLGDGTDTYIDQLGKLGAKFTDVADKAAVAKAGLAGLLQVYTDRDLLGDNAIDQSIVNKLINGDDLADDDIQKIAQAGVTDETISKMRDYVDTLYDTNNAMRELRDEAITKTADAFSKFTEELDRNSDKITHLQKVTTTYKNIIDIVGKRTLDASGELSKALDRANWDMQRNNTHALKSELDMIDNSVSSMKETMARLQEENINGQHDETLRQLEQQLKDMEDKRDSTYESWLDSWEAEMQAATDIFSQSLAQIVDDFSRGVAGAAGTLDHLAEEFARKGEIADIYVDDYEKIYNLSKLTRDIEKSIDDTENIKSKKALRDLMGEIEELQESDVKLSEYDLENLRRRYELELAREQLKESQDAKSQVRMKRDSEGNYGYVYTADENAVAEAEQNYEDKLYAMQKANGDYINDLQNKIISAEQACADALAKLDASQFASYEEYQAAVAQVQDDYNQLIEGYSQQLEGVIENNRDLYDTDWREYSDMTGYKISADEDYVDKFEETRLAELTGLESINDMIQIHRDTVQDATNDMIAAYEQWRTDTQLALSDGESSIEDYGNTVENVTTDVLEEADEVEQSAKDTAQVYSESYGAILNKMEDFTKQYDEKIARVITINNKLTESILAISKAVGALNDSEEIANLLTAAQALEKTTAAAAANAEAQRNAATSTPSTGGRSSGSTGNNSETKSSDDNGGRSPAKAPPVKIRNKADAYALANIADMGVDVNVVSNGKKAGDQGTVLFRTLTRKNVRFATGGYTGDWGTNDGKLAVLDKKELVLNADDTQNILSAVDMIRTVSKTIDINALSAANGLSSLFKSAGINQSNNNDTIEQNVTITATFTEPVGRTEIEAAFDNLINKAAQYANRK